jgi:DNA-binding CsgD family transcriptional regulator
MGRRQLTAAGSETAVDLLDVDSAGQNAAFGVDENGLLVLWNEAAERLLGHSVDQVLGRPCFEVICGRDIFGNLYCRGDCNVHRMVRGRSPVQRFQLYLRSSIGEFHSTALRIVSVPRKRDSEYTLIHLVQPIDIGGEVDRLTDPTSGNFDSAVPGHSPHTTSASHSASLPLTPRENEVLALLARGSSTSEISRALCISIVTVRNHIQHILHKLTVHSMVEAVSLAYRRHLV